MESTVRSSSLPAETGKFIAHLRLPFQLALAPFFLLGLVDAGADPSRDGMRLAVAFLAVHVGLYGGANWGDTGFAFGAAYTRHAISTSREASFPGFTDTLTASYGAATGQVFGELNHAFDFGDLSLTPFAQVAYVAHATDAFTEQGGAAALSSAADVVAGTFTTLGLRGSQQFVVGGDGLGTLSGGFAWRHAFAGTPTASNAFAGGGAFTVAGAPIAADALVLEAGVDLDLASGLDLSVTYDGQIAAAGQSHALKAGVGGQF
jgi:outer membrane autotransporter protein